MEQGKIIIIKLHLNSTTWIKTVIAASHRQNKQRINRCTFQVDDAFGVVCVSRNSRFYFHFDLTITKRTDYLHFIHKWHKNALKLFAQLSSVIKGRHHDPSAFYNIVLICTTLQYQSILGSVSLGSLQLIEENGYEARQPSREQTEQPAQRGDLVCQRLRFMLEGP